MTGYDVHTDKALRELRARLEQAERERDEARQHARAAERDAVEAETRCAALIAERDEARAALASEPARIAAAEMARDVRWTLAALAAGAEHVVSACLRITMSQVEAIRRTWAGGCTLDDIAAAIRAARGAL